MLSGEDDSKDKEEPEVAPAGTFTINGQKVDTYQKSKEIKELKKKSKILRKAQQNQASQRIRKGLESSSDSDIDPDDMRTPEKPRRRARKPQSSGSDKESDFDDIGTPEHPRKRVRKHPRDRGKKKRKMDFASQPGPSTSNALPKPTFLTQVSGVESEDEDDPDVIQRSPPRINQAANPWGDKMLKYKRNKGDKPKYKY